MTLRGLSQGSKSRTVAIGTRPLPSLIRTTIVLRRSSLVKAYGI